MAEKYVICRIHLFPHVTLNNFLDRFNVSTEFIDLELDSCEILPPQQCRYVRLSDVERESASVREEVSSRTALTKMSIRRLSQQSASCRETWDRGRQRVLLQTLRWYHRTVRGRCRTVVRYRTIEKHERTVRSRSHRTATLPATTTPIETYSSATIVTTLERAINLKPARSANGNHSRAHP